MDWSYELLTEGERDLLCGLAVFAGRFNGCQRRGRMSGGRRVRCLEFVESLVDASLVRAEDDAGSGVGMRYRLLETVREYAGQRLARVGTTSSN